MSASNKNTTRSSEHPAHVWEAQRLHFAKLYNHEDRALKEVQRIMQVEHGFCASQRQYKRKIKAWGLEKNSKATEKSHALMTLRNSDTRLDIDSVYKVNGKQIAAHKLMRHARLYGCEIPNTIRSLPMRRHRATKIPSNKVEAGLSTGLHPHNDTRTEETLSTNMENLNTILHNLSHFHHGVSCRSEETQCIMTFDDSSITSIIVRVECFYCKRGANLLFSLDDRLMTKFRIYFSKDMVKKILGEYRWIPLYFFVDNFEFILNCLRRDWEFLRSTSAETLRITELANTPPKNEHKDLEVSEAKVSEIPDLDMPDVPVCAMGDTVGFETNDDAPAEPLHIVDFNFQGLLGDGLHHQELTPTSVSDCIPYTQTMSFNQGIGNNAIIPVGTSTFGSINPLPEPWEPWPWCIQSFSIALPTPNFYPMDTPLLCRATKSPDMRDGPMPDLETFLDPSLWENNQISSPLDRDSVLLLEQDGAAVEPVDSERRNEAEHI